MKIIAVAGTKNTGKTTLVTKIVSKLTSKGFNVGTVKHTHVKFDIKGKDTWKHRESGAELVVGAGGGETFFILDHGMKLEEIINSAECLSKLDFLILEGYKPANYAKISTSPLDDPFTLSEVDVPKLDEEAIGKLTNLIENRSFGKLTNMDCGECGYENCRAMALAVVKGEVKEDICIMKKSSAVMIKVNGKPVPLNPFVEKFIKNTVLGMLSSLKMGNHDEYQNIELLIQNESNR